MWITCPWTFIQCRRDQVLGWAYTTRQSIFNGFSCSSWAADKSLLAMVGWWTPGKKMNIPPSWFSCFWYDVCGEHSHTELWTLWATFKTTGIGTACMRCIHYLWVTDRISDDRRPENIVRKKKTNATKYPLNCTKEGCSGTTRRWSACERQSRRKDVVDEPPASDSTSDRFWRQ